MQHFSWKDLSMEHLNELYIEYKRNKNELRFGQYVIDLLPSDTTWARLFYEQDNDKAYSMIANFITARGVMK